MKGTRNSVAWCAATLPPHCVRKSVMGEGVNKSSYSSDTPGLFCLAEGCRSGKASIMSITGPSKLPCCQPSAKAIVPVATCVVPAESMGDSSDNPRFESTP